MIERRIYPSLLIITIITLLIVMQVMQFARLYEHIKNDKYLVGKKLVNYHPYQSARSQVSAPQSVNEPHPQEEGNPQAEEDIQDPDPLEAIVDVR